MTPGSVEFEHSLRRIMLAGELAFFICYDIASLRQINNAYSRQVGDELLLTVATWTRRFPHSSVYRIEGDLYCVVLEQCTAEEAHRYALEFDKRFYEPWHVITSEQSHAVYVHAAIAVMQANESVLKQYYVDLFERALDYAREHGGMAVFDERAERQTRELNSLRFDLKNCVLQDMNGFDVHFQPIVNPITGRWVALEALCRWNRPGHGPVSPVVFIREAEEMDLIHVIGRWMIESSVQICKEMGFDRLDDFYISVNVSALQITRFGLAERILDILRVCDYPPHSLTLEITESTEFTFSDETRHEIDRLRESGVRFALDDFGTGYSGFNSLKQLPVDLLKTERAFIMDIENDTYLQYFYYILSETAHASGLRLVAEGVETIEQLNSVVKNGADLVQGYLFSKPIPASELARRKDAFLEPEHKSKYCGPELLDFKQWLRSQNAYQITPSLFSLMSGCLSELLNAETPQSSINTVLGIVGEYLHVKRVYVFLRDHGTVFSNKYEWCARGVESQMALFQRMDCAADGFYDVLLENELVIASAYQQLPDQLQGRLEESGRGETIQSIVVMPMNRRDKIIGFVGFDDDCARRWTPEEMIVLHHLCLLTVLSLGDWETELED